MTEKKKRFIGLIAFGIVIFILCLYSVFRLRFFPTFPYPWLQWSYGIFYISILILGLVYIGSVFLFKFRFIGMILSGIGITMLIFSLFSIFLGATLYGITMLIFSLFSIFLGATFFPSKGVIMSGITMLIFSLFSIFFGSAFFPSSSRINLSQLLILISGLIFIVSSIFLFRLKNWARRLSVSYSTILLLYFVPLSIFLIPDPWGWGGVMALSFSPYIIFPLFFIIFFTRPKIKEQFKK